MRINHGQRFFRVLARQILLSIFQIGIGQVIVRVRRVRESARRLGRQAQGCFEFVGVVGGVKQRQPDR